MSDEYNFKINFFGWCNEDGHDKVWGFATVGGDTGTLYNFWGKRGKALTFKKYEGWWGSAQLGDLARKKTRPRTNGTYRNIPPAQIESVVPGFHAEFENQLVMAKLFDKFHGNERVASL